MEFIYGGPGTLVAAARGAAAGGFVASSLPFRVASLGAPAASVYLATLAADSAIDANMAVPDVSCALIDRAAIVAQASDTTFNVTTFTASTGAATDAIYNFKVHRTQSVS